MKFAYIRKFVVAFICFFPFLSVSVGAKEKRSDVWSVASYRSEIPKAVENTPEVDGLSRGSLNDENFFGHQEWLRQSGKYTDSKRVSTVRERMKEPGVDILFSACSFYPEKSEGLEAVSQRLPEEPVWVSREWSLYRKYWLEITVISVIFFVLIIVLSVFLFLFYRTRRLKEALEKSEASNRLILRNIKENIKYITPDYTILWHNSTMLHGNEPKKGLKCYEALYGFSSPCLNCTVQQSIETRRSSEFDKEYAPQRYKHVFVNPVYNSMGQLLGLVVRSEDITRQKMAEIELLRAKEKAEESDRLKTAFLANMSHEIRTPLNAIVGFSNLLIEESYGPEERRQFGEIIVKNSDLLLCLINDILDISRLETGRILFSYQRCDLIALCRQVLATTSYLKKESVAFVFNPPVEKYELITDVQRLQQVLINLITNASKFTENGTIALELKEDLEQNLLLFSVTDTGCGIPVDLQQRVFERFEKLNEYVQGTGLGLAISKLTVNKMGGNIWVDKTYTSGARFVFTHPLNLKET